MHIRKHKQILWDYNGTLLNDLEHCINVINSMLKERQLPLLDKSSYRLHFGFPVQNYYKSIGFNFEEEAFEKTGLEFIQRYNAGISKLQLMPFAKESLLYFKEKGFKQYILSARNEEALKQELEQFEIADYFQAVAGLANNYAAGKAQRAAELIKTVNAKPEECLLIGDTIHDSETAKSIGCDCILVEGGHHPREKLKACRRPVYKNLKEFTENFKA
jgi:phosphoglycolate phosphatase